MKTRRIPLLWRWTLRDLRERWLQVVGISLIIALGVAIFSGMGSVTPWRTKSMDESYKMLNMYDLKLELTPGSYLDAERLAGAIGSIPHADWIEDAALRLSFPTTVDASTPDQPVLVSGQVIGVDTAAGGPVVNKLHMTSGRALDAGDAGAPICIVEHNFATYYELEPGDRSIRISGGEALEPVGTGISAEHFIVLEEGSGVLGQMAQERFAVLFVPLKTAQEIAGLPGLVNEALITVPEELEERDLERLEAELQGAMDQAFPQVGLDLEKRSENRVYRLLYDEIASNQELYDSFGSILLLGAAFGAFILIGRVVDAQRREIGINMALGVSPRRIARRYLLIGAQIAFLGMVLGGVLGLLLNQPVGEMIEELMPTPYFETPFQPDVYVQGALVGMLIPFLAVLYPIWRAVRVAPVDAIQTGYLVSKGGGLAPLLACLPLPGSSFAQFPLRNLSRGLRRTIMTVLGLSTAIIVLIVLVGYIDTFREALDAGSQEAKGDAPNRMQVMFDDFYPPSGSPISDIASDSGIARAVPGVVLAGQAVGAETFDVVIQLLDLDNDLWTPTVVRGDTRSEGPGVLITEKAARDLGVDVGDSVTLRHPYRESRHAWRMIETPVQVMGIHPDMLRIAFYMDIEDATVMNLDGVVNSLHINPAAGADIQELRQELSQIKGVASAQQVSASVDALLDMFDEFLGLFVALQFVVLVMAFLIAFNTTRSNVDERRRDLATMFAFGTRVRTAIRMAMVENLIIGVLGTAVGIVLGWQVLNAILLERIEEVAPELNVSITVSPATFGWAVLIGVVVVAVTPVFLTRRLVKMDIPSTLRVIE
jgi:putative ABC transport system permease protein